MKLGEEILQSGLKNVTPYAGVWIEMITAFISPSEGTVTPYAGVWIEIFTPTLEITQKKSLPTRECGLKWQ